MVGLTQVYIPDDDRLTGDGPLKLIWAVSTASITGGTLTNEENGSTLRAAWFSRDDIASLPRASVLDWALSLPALTGQAAGA